MQSELLAPIAQSDATVLIFGESGTGKEHLARRIHAASPRHSGPFVAFNCAQASETLIEATLFGHAKGAFTGAHESREGVFQRAHGGTLYLDEIGETSLTVQAKLLRAIQERVFRRIGANEDIKVDVRIIAATNRDLEAAVAKGTFREDLYYRLNVILLKTPPLRERKGDVGLLMDRFLDRFAKKLGKAIQAFSPEARSALESYPWPGNVRELENIVERAITLENSPFISLESLPESIQPYARRPAAAPSAPSPTASPGPVAPAGGGHVKLAVGMDELDGGDKCGCAWKNNVSTMVVSSLPRICDASICLSAYSIKWKYPGRTRMVAHSLESDAHWSACCCALSYCVRSRMDAKKISSDIGKTIWRVSVI
jgi:transcriptional regulator with GAF, ATPase, and Fis domain